MSNVTPPPEKKPTASFCVAFIPFNSFFVSFLFSSPPFPNPRPSAEPTFCTFGPTCKFNYHITHHSSKPGTDGEKVLHVGPTFFSIHKHAHTAVAGRRQQIKAARFQVCAELGDENELRGIMT
jgi:hypothetical protein